MPLLFQKMIYRQDLRNNPQVLYLFGDNEARAGTGGQARECRGEKNSVGVATKKLPSRAPGAYWSDDDYDRCSEIIIADLEPAFRHARRGGIIICPSAGLGTDRAELPERAPRVFAFLRARIKDLKSAAE